MPTSAPSDASDLGAPSGFGERTRHALDRLSGAQKSAIGVPAYLRFVNRRIGGWIAAVAYGIGLSPNHLTALSALFSFAGIAALVGIDAGPVAAALIALSLLLGYAFDSADGQLSRVRGGGKPSGEWLDHVVDVAKTSSLHAGVLVSLARYGNLGSDTWLAIPLAFGVVNITFFFGMMLRDQLGAKPPKSAADGASATGAGSVLRSLVLLPMDYGTLCFAFFALAWPATFLVIYGAFFAFMALFTVQSFVKAYRTLSA